MTQTNKDKNKLIGERIRSLREEAGLTQSQLGELLENKFSATAISLYESGEREVSIATLEEMAQKFEVSIDYLVSGEEVTKIPSLRAALRTEKGIGNNTNAQKQILDFVEFVKKQSKNNEGSNK